MSCDLGQQMLVMEAMKMQHVVKATTSGVVRMITVDAGRHRFEGHPLAFIEPGEQSAACDRR